MSPDNLQTSQTPESNMEPSTQERSASPPTPTTKTNDPPPEPPPVPASNTAPSYPPTYTTAQPSSAASMPTPTGTTEPFGNDNYTPTTTVMDSTGTMETGPPPPQPGAIPQPQLTPTSTPSSGGPTVPPPPKAGEAPSVSAQGYGHHYGGQHTHTTMPQAPILQQQQQQGIPNSTSTPYPRHPYPHHPATGASFPPQNYGSGSGSGSGYGGYSSYSYNAPQNPNMGFGGGPAGVRAPGDLEDDDEESVYNTARSWLQSAGIKLAEVEAAVWKRINDAHDGK